MRSAAMIVLFGVLPGCRHFTVEDIHWARDEAKTIDEVEDRFGYPNKTVTQVNTGTESWTDTGHHLMWWGLIPIVGLPILIVDLSTGDHYRVIEITFDTDTGKILGRKAKDTTNKEAREEKLAEAKR